MTFAEMLKVSITMPMLLILSIGVTGLAFERLYYYWFAEKLPSDLWERVLAKISDGDKPGAVSLCRRAKGTVPEALARLLSIPEPNTEKLTEAFLLYRQRAQLGLSRRVGFFGTVSFISPLIGLMGTVLGIMRAFHDLSVAGAGGPAVVAAGISEALISTAAGIGVAVASAILYNYFTLSARHRLNTLDLWVFELSAVLSETGNG